MARWEPNAPERLAKAGLELFEKRGYDATTVADIAARAGLTERTFFRYFGDKREVLFGAGHQLQDLLVAAVAAADESLAAIEIVTAAFEASGPMFEERREFARKRQALIAVHAELRERELVKLAGIAAAMAEALRARGVPDAAASLAAEAGMAIFKIAFERWVHDGKRQELARHVRKALDELKAVTSGAKPKRAR